MNLTDNAKKTARYLVDCWRTEVIDQYFELIDATTGGDTQRMYVAGKGIISDFDVPPIGTIHELNSKNLLSMVDRQEIIAVNLLQDLISEVENNFGEDSLKNIPEKRITEKHEQQVGKWLNALATMQVIEIHKYRPIRASAQNLVQQLFGIQSDFYRRLSNAEIPLKEILEVIIELHQFLKTELSLLDAVENNFGDGKQMSLSREAMESGKYLVEQLKLKHIDRTIELTDATAINDRTRQYLPVMGIHSDDFELPNFEHIEELATKNLIRITENRNIKVLILEDLTEAVNRRFIEESPKLSPSASSIFGEPLTSPQFQVDVFMVMPFKNELKPIYDEYIKPLVENLGYSIKRGDEVFAGHFVPREIYSLTFNSKLVIADCTGQNANVYYELGIAHMLDKKAILISQESDDIRFDVQQMRYLIYNPDDMAEFEENLTHSIKLIMDE